MLRWGGEISEPFQHWALTVTYSDGTKRRFTFTNVNRLQWKVEAGASMLILSDVYGNAMAAFDAECVTDAVRVQPARGNGEAGRVQG